MINAVHKAIIDLKNEYERSITLSVTDVYATIFFDDEDVFGNKMCDIRFEDNSRDTLHISKRNLSTDFDEYETSSLVYSNVPIDLAINKIRWANSFAIKRR